MITDPATKEILTKEIHHKLHIAELHEQLVNVTYCLLADDLYTVDHAIPKLIKIINLLEKEQEGIMHVIGQLEGITFEHKS